MNFKMVSHEFSLTPVHVYTAAPMVGATEGGGATRAMTP